MFKAIKNLFKKNKKKAEEALDFKEVLILEDITYENEVVKSKTKDTKETKSTLTFGK
jgi:tRNA U38,U39,U40 pseudouridine synthase TruA